MATKETPFDKYIEAQEEPETPFDKYINAQDEAFSLPALAGESFLNAILATPSAMGELLTFGGAAMGGPAAVAMSRTPEARASNPLANIPAPEVGEIAAGVRAIPEAFPGGEGFSVAYGQDLAEQDVLRRQTEREHPVGSQFAQLGGQAAAIVLGRMPFLNRVSKFEDMLMTVNKPDMFFSTAQAAKAPTTIRSAVSDAVANSKALRSLARGAGRSLEAGLEATAIDLINGNDPGETFGYAAGLQLGNSALLQTGKSVFGGSAAAKATKLTATLFVGAALWQQLQIATPLDDNFLSALNASGDKIFLGLALGTAAAIAGGGRLRGSTDDMSKQAQVVLDSITGVPRNTVTGFMSEMSKMNPTERQSAEALLAAVLTNPEAFSQGEMMRIGAAIDKGTFGDTAEVMMRDRKFIERLGREPHQPDFSSFSEIPFEKPIR